VAGSLRRVPFLARLAGRYALRHKAQTLRAILGLLVATTVLAAGLGMGESIAASLEDAALAQFGPIDVVLTADRPVQAAVAEAAGVAPAARAQGASGAATLAVLGPASNPRTGLAEAFSSIRGVSAQERAALGALRGPSGGEVAEPGPGEVVLAATLAQRLDAQVGDRVVLRAPPPGSFLGIEPEGQNLTGLAGPSGSVRPHVVQVRKDAIAMGAGITWFVDAGTVRVEATSPSGVTYANESATSPLVLLVEPPLEEGAWTVSVRAERPAAYLGALQVGYLPDSLGAGFVTLEARVSGIAADEGRAAITGRPAALVPLGDLQTVLSSRGLATNAYFRVTGDPYRAAEAIHAALPASNESGFQVRAQKAETISRAREAGSEVAGFLLVMGGFTLLAAVLLAFTLFSALVEERRAELGIARALGLTRGEVAFSMTLEGGLYAFAAALAGLLLGVGILAALLPLLGGAAVAEGGPRFSLHVSPGTLGLAFGIGVLLPLATIGIASLRFARLDPARAIRGIPDDPKGKRNLGLVLAAALAVPGALLLVAPPWHLVGVPFLAAALAVALQALRRPWLALLAAGLGFAHVAWTLYAFDAFPQDRGELDPILTLARGALLALGASALAVSTARPYLAVMRAANRGREPRRSTFIAVKYLLARRRPVGLTMAMVSIVVVVVTVMGTLFSVFSQTIPDNEAGYTVIGEAPLPLDGFPRPLPADLAASVERADFMPRHVGFRQANASRGGEEIEFRAGSRQFLGVTPGFAQANEYELSERAPAYPDDRAAWQAVADGKAVLFPDWALERNNLTAGETLTLQPPGLEPKDYVVAGGVRSQFTFQTFLAAADVEAMGFPQGAQVYVRVAPGADPNVVAHRLTDLYGADGLTATSIPEEVARLSATAQALVLVFEAFLALGLFVGLAATGFLASRAVHERMRDIGTLRALGFEEGDVRRAFILESTLTTGVGVLLGIAAGLLVAHSIWWRNIRDQDVPFTPPWLLMAGFTLAVLGLAALASNGPARRAARLPPAIAVRYVE
jgi:putative ABC transport system permease protein